VKIQATSKQEYRSIHKLLERVASHEEVDLKGTEYESHGVGPEDVHRTKKEHKEAARLLTRALEERTSIVSELESWDEDYEHDNYCGRWKDQSDSSGEDSYS